MPRNGEIATDMDAAWQSAKAIQAKEELTKGDIVVIKEDHYAFWFIEVDQKTQLAHIFREGHMEEGEPAWVGKHVKVGDVVTLANMTLAMNLHTNVDLYLVNSSQEIIELL